MEPMIRSFFIRYSCHTHYCHCWVFGGSLLWSLLGWGGRICVQLVFSLRNLRQRTQWTQDTAELPRKQRSVSENLCPPHAGVRPVLGTDPRVSKAALRSAIVVSSPARPPWGIGFPFCPPKKDLASQRTNYENLFPAYSNTSANLFH